MYRRRNQRGRSKLPSSGPADYPELSPESTRIVAEVSASALVGNFNAIRAQVPGLALLPMIKANAYGHGAEWAARHLAPLPGLYGLGVATLEEGASVRTALGPRYRKTRIFVFSGCSPWNDEKGEYCESYHLSPVISADEDWHRFVQRGWEKKLGYEIKFNTGMNRLGLSASLAGQVARVLRERSAEHHPTGVMSHLAMSEAPDSQVSRRQLELFMAIRAELGPLLPQTHFHLANSGGIWNAKHWRLKELTDVVRPGISLYGVPPWAGAPARGIQTVLSLRASVAKVLKLKPGDTVGYGATFRVSGGAPVHMAILTAGYADGVKRNLSNQGSVWLGGKKAPFRGIISMDLSAVECSEKTKPGDWAELLGANTDPWETARAAGTIPYELLTSISSRVQRIYG